MKLEIWDAAVPAERARWADVHAAWERREVFAHPAYVSLFTSPGDRALAAYGRDDNGWVLYPFIVRQVTGGGTDLTSPYGYGGAYRGGSPAADAFWAELDAWARQAGAVSEFVRFSLFDDQLLAYPGEREEKLTNVVRDLALDEEALWSDYDHKVRKNVSKARRGGVTIEHDATGAGLDEFFRIYGSTMDRREARAGYYFPRSFFETIAAELSGQFMYFHARLDGRVISTELALVSAENVYSFLGGTDADAFELRPNDLLKHELIVWAKHAGKRRFVLGGGYAPDDGIFKYKRAFAPSGLVPFHVGRRVLDPEAYARLTRAHEAAVGAQHPGWAAPAAFFPAYRAPGPE